MEDDADTAAGARRDGHRAASPYATGGGGFTFERRVGVVHLARMLTGATGVTLRGRTVEKVAFQQAPEHRVDDLVVTASRDDGSDPLKVAIAARRAPKFVRSDSNTEQLFRDLLADLREARRGDVEHRLAVCVAGRQPPAEEVQRLVDLATGQGTVAGFIALVRSPRRFDRAVRDRLERLLDLVETSLSASGADASRAAAENATWQLLRHLDILMLRVEPPDLTDWEELLNQLKPWGREQTLEGATALRDRLEALVAAYAPAAADVDLSKLRRDAHDVLHLERRRRAAAWAELRRLDDGSRRIVRKVLGAGDESQTVSLPRGQLAFEVRNEISGSEPLIVTGESGVGKSALVIGELAAAAADDPGTLDVVYLDLRQLPKTMADLRHRLGVPLEDLLGEMSAPIRILALDAADVIVERGDHLLFQLLQAARKADVTPWVVSATDGESAVRSVVERSFGTVGELRIGGLDDTELDEIATAFPQLRRLHEEPRAKELMRRPAVVDLLLRSGGQGIPLSEADAFKIVWNGLIRNDERRDQGLPDAREQVMRHLAWQQLRRTPADETYRRLDPTGVAGLQHHGLLRAADRWGPLPVFTHELLRTFAVARVLLSLDDLVEELIACDAPRWTLPAVRLALQDRLAAPDVADWPLAGRFALLQSAMNRLVAAGHGDRWADLPTEAVLTLPVGEHVLRDAWAMLLEDDAVGLRRLLRVVQQRHGRTGIVHRLVAEPVVVLLLEQGWPHGSQKAVNGLLTNWLRGLVLADEPVGHELRIRLRERLVARVAAGDKRKEEIRREHEARLAARSPEEVAEHEARARKWAELDDVPFPGIRRSRPRRELPGELTDEDLLEQLALLGPDLAEDGEALLRRVAADAPQRLTPAVDDLYAGRALASYNAKLLIDLVEAYYIEERDDDLFGSGGFGDDGVRHHRSLGVGVPMAASYRGPFVAMFRADLPAGAVCVNRLLNHAARARVAALGRPYWGSDEALKPEDRYLVELGITGEKRTYVGDGHVWLWYRGTGVGPPPCMSALQALELVCDQYLEAGLPLNALVKILLDGCENLAMPALLVGILVRHLERVEDELDPYLAEPEIWHFEFSRALQERSSLAAHTAGITAPDRRTWNLRDVSTRLALSATDERIETLREIGRRLVARAKDLAGAPGEEDQLAGQLATVRAWAGSLDRDSYTFTETTEGIRVEQVVDEEIAAHLAPSNVDLVRGQEASRLLFAYPHRYDHLADRADVTRDELISDIATARDLANQPPAAVPSGPYDGPAAVAAAALEARFLDEVEVPPGDLAWAATLLVGLVNAFADQGASEDDYSIFGIGPDRAAARALPLLWLPAAHNLRESLDAEGIDTDTINRAVGWIVGHAANETRLFLARGFDPIWPTPCDSTSGECHHVAALAIIEDTARDSLIGPWDQDLQRNTRLHIDGPVAPRLATAKQEQVYVPQLNATIRGASAAAASSACCRDDARTLLAAALAAHRRGMHAFEHGYMHSSNDAIVVARAVLDVASTGDMTLLFSHIDDYAENPRLLSEFLRALAAAGEESQARAVTARRVWPALFDHVVELAEARSELQHVRFGESPLAAVIPMPSYETGYLHREYEGDPIRWADPAALAPQIERWIPVAAGQPETVDALAHLLSAREGARQAAQPGLPWMEKLVMADPEQIANRSFLLPEWLERVRPSAAEELLKSWHRMVDALTVAGDHRVARLAD